LRTQPPWRPNRCSAATAIDAQNGKAKASSDEPALAGRVVAIASSAHAALR
jgi:hypothetical protein